MEPKRVNFKNKSIKFDSNDINYIKFNEFKLGSVSKTTTYINFNTFHLTFPRIFHNYGLNKGKDSSSFPYKLPEQSDECKHIRKYFDDLTECLKNKIKERINTGEIPSDNYSKFAKNSTDVIKKIKSPLYLKNDLSNYDDCIWFKFRSNHGNSSMNSICKRPQEKDPEKYINKKLIDIPLEVFDYNEIASSVEERKTIPGSYDFVIVFNTFVLYENIFRPQFYTLALIYLPAVPVQTKYFNEIINENDDDDKNDKNDNNQEENNEEDEIQNASIDFESIKINSC